MARKIALGLLRRWLPADEQIELLHQAGYDGAFTYADGSISVCDAKRMLTERGMEYPFVHVMWEKLALMWEDSTEDGEFCMKAYLKTLEDCAECEVPMMVAHAIVGMEKHTPTELGAERFSRVLRRAEELGVQLCLENTEGEEYLKMLFDRFGDSPMLKFCWDTGHEMCYNHSKDLLLTYGKWLGATHLNDNLGISHPEEGITWRDDLHLLPFDGIGDWDDKAKRLVNTGYNGIITFELSVNCKPGSNANTVYAEMTPEDYLGESIRRARRFTDLMEKYEK